MMYTVHMRFTLRLIAYLILHVPTLFSDHSFPDTKQREKLPVWAAILVILVALVAFAGVLYVFLGAIR